MSCVLSDSSTRFACMLVSYRTLARNAGAHAPTRVKSARYSVGNAQEETGKIQANYSLLRRRQATKRHFVLRFPIGHVDQPRVRRLAVVADRRPEGDVYSIEAPPLEPSRGARRISAPRGVPAPLRHRGDSSPGMTAVGGFFFIFEPIPGETGSFRGATGETSRTAPWRGRRSSERRRGSRRRLDAIAARRDA